MSAFPPRLPEQPIFYPVTNLAYATKIARDWNTKANSRAGFVTRFEIDDAYGSTFDRRIVGSREHEELWVPAERLDEFNSHILQPIDVVAAYFGADFRGHVPEGFGLRERTAREQFVALAKLVADDGVDFIGEVATNHEAVYLNYFFWETNDFDNDGIDRAARDALLSKVRTAWSQGVRRAVRLGVVAA